MSLTPRNLFVPGFDLFSNLIQFGLGADLSGTDGSPIYTQLDADLTISGSYTVGDIDYSYSGTITMDTLTRIGLRDASVVGGISDPRYTVTGKFRDHVADLGYTTGTLTGNQFVAVQVPGAGSASLHNPLPFDPPFFFASNALTFSGIVGTRTDNSAAPPTVTDAYASVVFEVLFTGAIETGDLVYRVKMTVTLNVGEAEQYQQIFYDDTDASAWGMPDFRDVRGTYSPSGTDGNGISHTGSFVIS